MVLGNFWTIVPRTASINQDGMCEWDMVDFEY